jgi:two-component system response regulator YesN
MLDEVSREMEENVRSASGKDGALDQKNIPAVKQRLMQALVDKSYLDPEDIFREMEPLGLRVSLREPFTLLMISIDDFELNVFSEVIQEVQLLKFSVANILEEVLGQSFVCDVYGMDRGSLLAVLCQDRGEDDMRKGVEDAFGQVCEYMVRYLNISVSGAMSGVCRFPAQIPEAVRALSGGLAQRIFRGKSFFYTPKGKAGHAGMLRISDAGIAHDMDRAVSKNGDELIRYLERFFHTIQALGTAEENDIRESYFEMYRALNHCASGYGIDINKLTDEQGSRLHYVILKADTMTMVRDSFLAVARRFLELLRSEKKPLVRQDILKAQKYIRNNLSEHLTVTGVAEMLNMNGSYFSHLFKKQTGKSFVDYVNEARIEKAKVLCATTDYRIYEIAAMVGIDNPNYFSELFKKITGKNPNDYRQR